MSVRALRSASVALATLGLLVLTLALTPGEASAATPPVGLGTATSYAVLAGSTITNDGNSVLHGDRGLSPGTSVTGFPPGLLDGASHTADAEALQAKNDLTVAYVDAAGRTPAASVAAELGGSTFLPGTYVGATLQLTGSMTIDAGGDPDAVFLFKTNDTLITASDSSVVLIGEADPCNIYWQVTSSATIGTGTDFVGTVMASESITANSGADVVGRLLARTSAVTLNNNEITVPECEVLPPGSTTTTLAPSTTLPPVSTTGEPVTTTAPITTTTEAPVTTTTEAPVTTTAPTTTTTEAPVTTTLATTTTTEAPAPISTTSTTEADVTLSSVAQDGSTTTTDATSTSTSTDTTTDTTGTLARTGSAMGVPTAIGLLALSGGLAILAIRRRIATS